MWRRPKGEARNGGDGFDGARGENCWRSVLLKPFSTKTRKLKMLIGFVCPRGLIRFGTDEAMCSDPEHGLIFGHVVPFLGADLQCEWWALRLPSFRENCSGIQHQGQGEVGHGRAEDPWPQLGIAASCFLFNALSPTNSTAGTTRTWVLDFDSYSCPSC